MPSPSTETPVEPRSNAGLLRTALFAAVVLGLGFVLFQSMRPPTPEPLGRTGGDPVRFRHAGSAWYWLENPAGPRARLMRAEKGRTTVIAEAEEIPSYSLDGETPLWVERTGDAKNPSWSVKTGTPARTLLTMSSRIFDVLRHGSDIYIAAATPLGLPNVNAAVEPDVPLPPFGAKVALLKVPAAGVEAHTLSRRPAHATLLEREASFLGVRGDSLIVAGQRPTHPGSSAIYEVPLDRRRAPVRTAGIAALASGTVTRDGRVVWLAPSTTASNYRSVQEVRALGAGGEPVKITDWLRWGGTLTDTERGLYLVDSDSGRDLWRIPSRWALPERVDLKVNQVVVAVGGGQVVLANPVGPQARELSTVPLP
jgi:hypothetical protein